MVNKINKITDAKFNLFVKKQSLLKAGKSNKKNICSKYQIRDGIFKP
jgi:hypothetical protein